MILSQDFRSLSEWLAWSLADSSRASRNAIEHATLTAWATSGDEVFLIPGSCVACEGASIFALDDRYSPPDRLKDGWEPNWRERLECRRCGLNNRMRAVLSITLPLLDAQLGAIWLSEQTTPLFRFMSDRFANLVGSEYLGEHLRSGDVDITGLRHEDATAPSFTDNEISAALSFDVLEHVPDYRLAFAQTYRVLAEEGWMIWTAPFRSDLDQTLIRAMVNEDMTIRHIYPPEYHGDPVNPDGGILCFQHFGWDILTDLREVGFRDAFVRVYWNDESANLGPLQTVFLAQK